ncbi:hypothetical protein T4B_8753 [Trichinella pseudospiralis]|uniref:Uncharacterized protein n=1 Tax=Trichinella pseudospiralis TaxID=6337 RepID=A0A0V1J755_TRIPS|nr:hypothetical protein T4B_8753 [Trichinella pseudospiralis]KRZ46009.1 hypothetical protein T4C_379 [Trichinella pseudospiralis]
MVSYLKMAAAVVSSERLILNFLLEISNASVTEIFLDVFIVNLILFHQGSLFWAQHYGTICSKQLDDLFANDIPTKPLSTMSVDCLEQRGFNGLQVYCDCYISAGLKHLGLVTAEDEIGYFCHFEASKC